MLALVMTEVCGAGLVLVLAVRRYGRPAELERQHGKQDDGEEATHGKSLAAMGVGVGCDKAGELWGLTTSRSSARSRGQHEIA